MKANSKTLKFEWCDRMKIKIICMFMVLSCAAGLLTGCGQKNRVVNYETPTQKSTTITFFGNKYETENVIVIEQIISDFMKENPDIRVSYESLKGNDYFEALQKRMASGKGDDVFMVNHDVLLELKEHGQAAELSGLDTVANYTDQMRHQMEDDGQIYWLPTTVSAFGLYCNLDLLNKHKQRVPQTLPEWERVCDYFIKEGITPIIANNDISLKTLAIGRGFYPVYQENRQAEVLQRLNDGEAKLSDYLRSGFSIAEKFISKGYIDAEKALQTKKTSDDLQEFVKGESPFLLTGAWAAGRVEEMEPGFEFEVHPLPLLEDGALLVINPDTRLSVNAESKYPEAAMKFVEYFTRQENIQKFADQQSSFSPLKNGQPSSVKQIQPLVAGYQNGRTVIGTDTFLTLPIWELTAGVSKKLLSGDSMETALDWMDQQASQEREQ